MIQSSEWFGSNEYIFQLKVNYFDSIIIISSKADL